MFVWVRSSRRVKRLSSCIASSHFTLVSEVPRCDYSLCCRLRLRCWGLWGRRGERSEFFIKCQIKKIIVPEPTAEMIQCWQRYYHTFLFSNNFRKKNSRCTFSGKESDRRLQRPLWKLPTEASEGSFLHYSRNKVSRRLQGGYSSYGASSYGAGGGYGSRKDEDEDYKEGRTKQVTRHNLVGYVSKPIQ